MGIINYLILDDLSTIVDPNSSTFEKIVAGASITPFGKIVKIGGKLFKIVSKGSDDATYFAKGTGKIDLKDGMKLPTNKALDAAEDFLGKGYKDMGNGRYVSQDGKRVVRMGDGDILGNHGGGPHMNFETLVPNPAKPGKMKVDTNLHIFLED